MITSDKLLKEDYSLKTSGDLDPLLERIGEASYVLFSTLLPLRYDALIFIDKSNALNALHLKPDLTEVPETYPFGF